MVDIQSATAEIRRGKKDRRTQKKKKPEGKNIMACPLLWAAITSSASLTQFTAEHGEVATQDRPFLDALRPGR